MIYGGRDIASRNYSSVLCKFNLQTKLWVAPFPSPQLGSPPSAADVEGKRFNPAAAAGSIVGVGAVLAGVIGYAFYKKRQGRPPATSMANPKDLEDVSSAAVRSLASHKSTTRPTGLITDDKDAPPLPPIEYKTELETSEYKVELDMTLAPPAPRNPHSLPPQNPQGRCLSPE